MVVITLLTLFAVVGITFVLFAQSEASAARVWREAETQQKPAMDPEMLFAYFLGQLIYDTDNVGSGLRGHSLARNMYGFNADAGAANTLPYSGVGRLHYNSVLGQDDFNLVNYTYFADDGFLRDPERHGSRANPQAPPGAYVAGNPSYTYPDANNLYLAAVRGSDGRVLAPSFHRRWLFNPTQAFNDPANPNWSNAHGKYLTLRPRPADHSAAFPYPEDGGGDVKNLADSPGTFDAVTGQMCHNDSVWIDLGFPVMLGPDGRKFKPLFAPLVQDLDNRVNVNVHGYWFCHPNLGGFNSNTFMSRDGWGPWEVNLTRVLRQQVGGRYEFINLMRGANGVAGRYDPAFWGTHNLKLQDRYSPGGPFYAMTDYDGYGRRTFGLPGDPEWRQFTAFPGGWGDCMGNGGVHNTEGPSHARNFNFFSPGQNGWSTAGAVAQQDRTFPPANMEALLRYGDTGSPALASDLFRLCPQSFADAKTRRLVTTHSLDLLRPGVTPWAWRGQGATPYQLAAGDRFPSGGPQAFPTLPTAPAAGEFAADWRAASAGLRKVDLNRSWEAAQFAIKTLPAYPAPDATTKRIADDAGFTAAQKARTDMAREIFEILRQVAGAGDPNDAALPAEQKHALRWLAQLAVNIVDFGDNDDYLTPLEWKTGEWVFGTELPRLVINEAYAEITNAANDPPANQTMAQQSYPVKFWVELHNPLWGGANANTGGSQVAKLTEDARARLQVPANGADPAYAAYQLVIAKGPNPGLRNQADNSLGNPDPANIKTVVSDFTADPTAPAPTLTGDELNVVRPTDLNTSGTAGRNEGFYVLGPKDDFPGAQVTPTLRVKDQQVNGQRSSMVYELPKADLPGELPKHTLLLRRLACPHRKPQTDAAQPDYNPYVTVDYMDDVPTNDGVINDSGGAHASTPQAQRFAVGRNQPYAAHLSQRKDQKPATALANQPQHTLFKLNEQPATPFDWLTFIDRPLISPGELLQVSGFKPHELTQEFVVADAQGNLKKHNHRAPWHDANARIFRLFEFLEAGTRLQWTPMGGKVPGRININNVWDRETFEALCDRQPVNMFSDADVTTCYDRLLQSRSPGGVPGNGDRPFRSLAAPIAPANDPQYPAGMGIDDTLFRVDPVDASKRLFETAPTGVNNHPYFRHNLFTKIFNHVTTRSNVFAVWLTVGFFEVVDDGAAGRPPRLGAEIGRAENRHVRPRMFAIVDRTNLTVDAADPRKPGRTPFFLEAGTAVNAAGQATVAVPALSGTYEGVPWSIAVGTQLVVDIGQNQETVTVTAVSAAPAQFTATFAKPHPIGCAVSNAVLGNPGPQPRFDPRNPQFAGVVRYFSIIQ